MRKLIRAIIIIALITSLMIAQMVIAYASSAVIYVTADMTEAEPGDTIDFTVSLSPVSDMGTMQMVLDIPEGLTYVSRSGKLTRGLKNELGFDFADFTENSLMINGGASASDYSSNADTVICTFSCTVNDGFKGKAEVGLTDLEFYSCNTWEDHTGEFSVSKAVISVGQGATQGGSSDLGNTSDLGKASDPGNTSDSSKASDPGNTSNPDQASNPDKESITAGASESQSQSDTAQAEDKAEDGTSEANSSAQADEMTDQSANYQKTGNTGETAGNTAVVRAEEEHSSSFAIWLIALVSVLLIAVIIAVAFKKRKRQQIEFLSDSKQT